MWVAWPKHVVRLTWKTLVRDYVNLLLVMVPLGIVAGALGWDSTAVFTLNFFAIIPLASLLSFATEELAATMGQALGGLMNATFGNAVELIVSLTPLVRVGYLMGYVCTNWSLGYRSALLLLRITRSALSRLACSVAFSRISSSC